MNLRSALFPISIAPMLDYTDRHYRYFMRQITKKTILYTEMIVADAIIHGNHKKLLSYHELEKPLILQLGGSNPEKLALATKIAAVYNYDGINLNVGCPSSRVSSGNFGACLMQNANLVKECLQAIQNNSNVPVSIKHRIGLNYNTNYDFLHDFVNNVSGDNANVCSEFIVHARNAILSGLSPKQNREIPPLNYEYVYRLKQDFPHLHITINGGIKNLQQVKEHLQFVDAVMIGREAYSNPYIFCNVDTCHNNSNDNNKDNKDSQNISSRHQIALNMLHYFSLLRSEQMPLAYVTKHMLGLFHAHPQAKLWRRTLTIDANKANFVDIYYNLLQQLQ